MKYCSWRAAGRLFPASLALLLGAGAAVGQSPAYGSAPYLGSTPAPGGGTGAHPAQGVVYFEEAPAAAPPAPPAVAPAPIEVPADAPAEACPECSGGLVGRFRGRCATCGRNAIVPPPLGSYAHNIYAMQAQLARENFLVIDPWDWTFGSDNLNAGGLLHLDAIVRKLGQDPFPIKVAPGPEPALNEARRERIAALLAERGLPDASTRVVIGPSTAEGLRSDEIEGIGSHILMGDGACRGIYSPGGVLNGGCGPHP